jgi:tetratricopeptide (TPR) repeat protein
MEKHAKMNQKIILLGLCVSFLIMCASAANCDQKQIDYYVNTSQFGNAADCADGIGDYDQAIAYQTKAIGQAEELNKSTALKHLLIAAYYYKKAQIEKTEYKFKDKIKVQCDIAEPMLLDKITKELNRVKPSFISIASDYSSLAGCYKDANDLNKSCDYCLKENEYEKKAGRGDKLTKCEYYGCPKSTNNILSNGSESSSPSDGFPMMSLLIGAVILLILLAAIFLSKKKKK